MKELIQIQNELKAPKNQRNNFGKYNYRSCEDILEAVKPIANDKGCYVLINDQIELIGDRYYVKATATITNGEQSVSVSAYARESLTKKGMDDAQVTGATSSYARKYALNGLFAIDDTKDADATNNHKSAPRKTKAEIVAQARQGIKNSKTVNELNVLYGTLAQNIQTEMKPEFAQRRKEIEA